MGKTGCSLLTGMRLRFVQAWNGNNREAAIAAGYSEKNADVAAAKLVRDQDVRRALEEKQGRKCLPRRFGHGIGAAQARLR